jgi:hypothetical protein
MPSIELEILEPQHNATLVGGVLARLRGRVVTLSPPPLFFKWYSSLNVPSDVSKVALNFADDQALDFTTPLGVGSHVLIFTAKDVRGDALADLQAVQSAGMTGGPLVAPKPCIIHRFLATMKTPDPAGPVPNLSKASAILEALAPAKWGDAEVPGDQSDSLSLALHAGRASSEPGLCRSRASRESTDIRPGGRCSATAGPVYGCAAQRARHG